jgi:hypothetical protein
MPQISGKRRVEGKDDGILVEGNRVYNLFHVVDRV